MELDLQPEAFRVEPVTLSPMRTFSIFASILAFLALVSCQTGGFSRTDVDHDHFLNFDEFAATPIGKAARDPGAAFITADADRDGSLSGEEFKVYASSQSGR